MSRVVYPWRRGADFAIALLAPGVTLTGGEAIRVAGKRVSTVADNPPADDVAEDFVLTPTFVPAQGDDPAGWELTGTAEQSNTLEAGNYLVDALITKDGTRMRTAPVGVRVYGRVTGPGV